MCQINIILALVEIMAWRRQSDKPLSEPLMVSLPTHIYASLGIKELNDHANGSANTYINLKNIRLLTALFKPIAQLESVACWNELNVWQFIHGQTVYDNSFSFIWYFEHDIISIIEFIKFRLSSMVTKHQFAVYGIAKMVEFYWFYNVPWLFMHH